MNTLNPLAPAKKYRVTYKSKVLYADVIDYDPGTGVLTADKTTIMVFNPDKLVIIALDAIVPI